MHPEYMQVGSLMTAYNFILDLFLRYTFPGSWFLSALVVSVSIIYLCLKNKLNSIALLLLTLLIYFYIYHVNFFLEFVQGFHLLYEKNIRSIYLSFPIALFPVCLGSILASPDMEKTINSANRFKIPLLVTFCIFVVIYYNYKFIVFRAMVITLVFVLFYNVKLGHRAIYKKLRDLSILMFLWHFIVIKAFGFIYHERLFSYWQIKLFFLVLPITLTISMIILYLEKKSLFKWMKYFH